MKRASNLIEQIQDLDNLYLAYFKAKRGKSTTPAVIDYERRLDENIKALQRQLQTGDVAIGITTSFMTPTPPALTKAFTKP